MPKIGITIIKLEPRKMGEEVELTVKLAPIGAESDTHTDIRKLCVASKMMFEIGNIGVGSLPYKLSEEQFDSLEYNSKLWEVVRKGLDLLSYGDNTKSALITKLKQRGYDKFLAEDAVEYIAGLGYIDESRIMARLVDQLANVKLYGTSRIKNEIRKKGISEEIIREELQELLKTVDFRENIMRLLKRKCDFSRLSEQKYRESIYAAFYRLGYSPQETKSAIKTIQEEEYE